VAESFAEIFFGNSITLGMPCAVVSGEDIRSIAKLVEADPAALISLDLTEKKLSIADTDFPVTIADHAHEALVSGKWDAIADLLEGVDEVKARVASLPYMVA
jgi:3-isopropylmalate/(R)-2-methylmalate dehydratase small subunit